MALTLSSKAFGAGQPIPRRHTCDGQDLSPDLAWEGGHQETRALARIMDDPDAPVGVFTHWVLYNLPGNVRSLPDGVSKKERLESGALQWRSDFGRIGYGGPCPPPGRSHRYRFHLYALDVPLDLKPGATKEQVLAKMRGRILADAELVGAYQR